MYKKLVKKIIICLLLNVCLMMMFLWLFQTSNRAYLVNNFYELLSLGIMPFEYLICCSYVFSLFNLYTFLRCAEMNVVVVKAEKKLFITSLLFIGSNYFLYACIGLLKPEYGILVSPVIFAEKVIAYYVLGELLMLIYLKKCCLTGPVIAMGAAYVFLGWVFSGFYDIYAFNIMLLPTQVMYLLLIIIGLNFYLINHKKGDLIWEKD